MRESKNADKQNCGAQGDENHPKMGSAIGGQQCVVHGRQLALPSGHLLDDGGISLAITCAVLNEYYYVMGAIHVTYLTRREKMWLAGS
jgi:hypothetical protein